jgi:pimeloyl-ACP methyl ester carboxylesterase
MTEFLTIPCEGWQLNGLVHLPPVAPPRRIGVVLLHENINTKFGTHRLFRQVAEALAEAGFYVLRYDDRGTCDSPGERELTVADRVADACAAFQAFRHHCQLDGLIAWGLCMGAAVAVQCAARLERRLRPDGMILCSILADPSIVSGAEFGYEPVNLSTVLRGSLLSENPFRKLFRVARNFRRYWERATKLGNLCMRRYFGGSTGLQQRRKEIAKVPCLLAAWEGPCLMVFGEKDRYWRDFVERVNPSDKLGLMKKAGWSWALVREGDHTFASAEQTAELIRFTVEWAQALREGSPAALQYSSSEQTIHGFFAAPVAD